MFYHQDLSGWLDSTIGPQGLAENFFKHSSMPLEEKIKDLKYQHQKGVLPFLTVPYKSDDLHSLQEIALYFQQSFSDVLILGTGGSSLGGQALCALRVTTTPRLHFLDNIDPFSFNQLMQTLDLKKTGFIVISKSGHTLETLMQLLTCLHLFQKNNLKPLIATHFYVITENKASPLKNLAQHWMIPCLDHDPHLGGRYSVLSLVGLLPAMIAGLDAPRIRKGACSAMNAMLESECFTNCPPALSATALVEFAHHNKTNNVLMPYMDRLNIFSAWWRQLWAESLGKQGKGMTPINALGTVDQHSQLQLYLDGPPDKVFTLITTDYRHQGPAIPTDMTLNSSLDYLYGKTLGDLMFGEQKATLETLINNNCPVREIRLAEINEESLGALLMHFMLETVFAAHLLKVNPFDQPAVEEGKILARQYLETASR